MLIKNKTPFTEKALKAAENGVFMVKIANI
jgi:hypothetical protein